MSKIFHLRKGTKTWCGDFGTSTIRLEKMTCNDCQRALDFIGPIHPRKGRHTPWKTEENHIWQARQESKQTSSWNTIAALAMISVFGGIR